ncbi:PilZ domain-containing protein [uncultured Ilyobacter sp.]|uniref:PilZ domain-containing protein n=1 Tax=uncultured Ilyobacter sp. TaxID=544433 RepID=UPI0029F5738F|nr:PilZ domain-containing protein [uncultured Ilyobacter sp.]
MQLAIDLTARQAARVVEQAVRAQPEIELEPRNLPEDEPLRGKLIGREGEMLAVELASMRAATPLAVLMGAFCEIRVQLSGEMYLFTTHVLDAAEDGKQQRIMIAQPDMVQVLNRRGFERTNATVASQVRVRVPSQPSPAIGLLANVSPDGLACNLPGTALDHALALGDELRVSFELAGFDEIFELPCVLRNKDIMRDKQQLFLGLEFNVRTGDKADELGLQRLRAALYELMTDMTNLDGES